MLSKACEYAIRALILIMTYSLEGKRIGIKEISKKAGLPAYFIANLLKDLVKEGLLVSNKGPKGGFIIVEEQMDMNLMQVIQAIDGNGFFVNCGLGLPNCSDENPCPVHDIFIKPRDEFRDMCLQTSIEDLALKLRDGKVVLSKSFS